MLLVRTKRRWIVHCGSHTIAGTHCVHKNIPLRVINCGSHCVYCESNSVYCGIQTVLCGTLFSNINTYVFCVWCIFPVSKCDCCICILCVISVNDVSGFFMFVCVSVMSVYSVCYIFLLSSLRSINTLFTIHFVVSTTLLIFVFILHTCSSNLKVTNVIFPVSWPLITFLNSCLVHVHPLLQHVKKLISNRHIPKPCSTCKICVM